MWLPFAEASTPPAPTAPGASASLQGTAAVEKEMGQILPPLLSGFALVVLAVVLSRICFAAWARRRGRSDQGILPEQPVFPPPSHHERLRDPSYLRKILDRDAGDSRHRPR